MPGDGSSVRDALNHQSLQVSRDDPGPRPMIAVLDARPGLAGRLREKIAEQLAAQVRREPGCLTFTAYEARDVPGRFYLYEVYASAARVHRAPAGPQAGGAARGSPRLLAAAQRQQREHVRHTEVSQSQQPLPPAPSVDSRNPVRGLASSSNSEVMEA